MMYNTHMNTLFNLEDLHTFSNLHSVVTAQEARQLYGLSRNAVAVAVRRGSLRARKSSDVWLISINDLVNYRGYIPEHRNIPDELKPAFNQALIRYQKGVTESN